MLPGKPLWNIVSVAQHKSNATLFNMQYRTFALTKSHIETLSAWKLQYRITFETYLSANRPSENPVLKNT